MPETKPNKPTASKAKIIGITVGGAGVVAAVSMGIVLGLAPKNIVNEGHTVTIYMTKDDYKKREEPGVKPYHVLNNVIDYNAPLVPPTRDDYGFVCYHDAETDEVLEVVEGNLF